jgi:hypothetical protein
MKVLIIAASGVQPSGNGTTIRDKREDRVVVATPLAGLTSPQKSASESASLSLNRGPIGTEPVMTVLPFLYGYGRH